MDRRALQELKASGIPIDLHAVPLVAIRIDEEGQPIGIGEEVPVQDGANLAVVRLEPLSRLFTGNRRPPAEVRPEPSSPYILFYGLLERTAYGFCRASRRRVSDRDFERLYRQLRRRPDGRDPDVIFSYLQAACRLYLTLADLSQAEFEAVVQSLSISARRVAIHDSSHNYLDILDQQFGRYWEAR